MVRPQFYSLQTFIEFIPYPIQRAVYLEWGYNGLANHGDFAGPIMPASDGIFTDDVKDHLLTAAGKVLIANGVKMESQLIRDRVTRISKRMRNLRPMVESLTEMVLASEHPTKTIPNAAYEMGSQGHYLYSALGALIASLKLVQASGWDNQKTLFSIYEDFNPTRKQAEEFLLAYKANPRQIKVASKLLELSSKQITYEKKDK